MKENTSPGATFARNLTKLAVLHDLNDQRVAELVGVTPQTVSLWRHGKRAPGANALLAAARLFDAPPQAMYSDDFADLLPLDVEWYREVQRRVGAPRKLRAL